MGIPGHVVCIIVAIGFLVFHTFLLMNLSDRLQAALKRIDDLEMLLREKKQTTNTNKDKTITSNCLERLQMRLNCELKNVKNNNVKVPRLLKKIQRLKKRIKEHMVHSVRSKRYVDPLRRGRAIKDCKGNKWALYTIWGVDSCPANSVTVHKGQMVTTDGSDYLCLSDEPEEEPFRPHKTKGRTIGSSVSLRGVTYGDIEDVVSYDKFPPSGPKSKNNKTVPCALCARCNRSSSIMIVSMPKKMRKLGLQREYFGILMSSKESKKFICLSADARAYENKSIQQIIASKLRIPNAVQIHPGELRCDSMFCEVHKFYNATANSRIKCMVVTF